MNIEQGKARKKIPLLEEKEGVAFHGLMCSRLQGVDSKGLSAHCETPFVHATEILGILCCTQTEWR